MRRSAIIISVFFVLIASILNAQDSRYFTDRYRSAYNARQRMAVIREAADARPEGVGALYAEALAQLLLEEPSVKRSEDRDAADAMARLLCGLLGDEHYLPAAKDLWRVVQNLANPLVRADALIALGQMRALEYLEKISLLLLDLNLQPGTDPEASEKVAYGAVLGLEKYRDINGYVPVFLAANGWYSDRTRKQAEAALAVITDDPTTVLLPVIESAAFDIRTKALEKVNASQATPENKTKAAFVGLSQGWKIVSSEVKSKTELAALRKTALAILAAYGSGAEAVPLLKNSYESGYDFEEKTSALSAFAKNPSDAAAVALSAFLTDLNKKRQVDAVTAEDDRLVRALLQNMGTNGHPALKSALQDVAYLGWTNPIMQLAKDAIAKLRK